MDAHQQSPISEPLRASRIPIAQLSPTLEDFSRSSIHACVTLIWPYSSSTKSLSLLLAEPDFRLRHSNGQIKAVFHGPIAESVAQSRIGIGDSVYLDLAGARFSNCVAAIGTPGKSVAWDVHFDDRVSLEIWRSSKHVLTVKVDPPSPPLPNNDTTITAPVTPVAKGYAQLDRNGSIGGLESWQSPAFRDRSRTYLSGLADSVLDPFTEEDGFVPGKGRKRPRFSMQNSQWRVIDEPESPGERGEVLDWTHIFDEDWRSELDTCQEDTAEKEVKPEVKPPGTPGIENTSIDSENVSFAIPVSKADVTKEDASDSSVTNLEHHIGQATDEIEFPSTGVSRMAELSRGSTKRGFLDYSAHLPIETPRLHPIPSPGLPIPSPLVTMSNSPQGYFTPIAATANSHMSQVPTTLSQEFTGSEIEIPDAQTGTSRTSGYEEKSSASETEAQAVNYSKSKPETNAISIARQSTCQPHAMSSTTVADVSLGKNLKVTAEQGGQPSLHAAEKDTGKADRYVGDADQLNLNSEVQKVSEDQTRNRAQEIESEEHKGETHQGREIVAKDDLKDYGRRLGPTEGGIVTEDSQKARVSEEVEYDTDESEEESTDKLKKLTQYHNLAAESETEPPEEDHGHYSEVGDEGEEESNGQRSEDELEEVFVEEEEEYSEEEQAREVEEVEEIEEEENVESEEEDQVEAGWDDEEGWSEEELEEEAGVEDMYEDEDDEHVEPEIESDQMSVDTPAPKKVHPEVIVLDSDSEDEARPTSQTHPMTSSRQEIRILENESSDYETFTSGTGSLGPGHPENSESLEDEWGEGWSEENSEEEQLIDEDMEEGIVDDEHEQANDEQQKSEQAADEQLYKGRTRDEQAAKGLMGISEGYQMEDEATEEHAGIEREQVSISSTYIRDGASDTEERQMLRRETSQDHEQGGLEYRSNIMVSNEGPTSRRLEMAIDPELQNLEFDREQATKEVEEEHCADSSYAEIRTGEFWKVSEPDQNIDHALILDGSSSSQVSHGSLGAVLGKPSPMQQLVALGASQLVEIGQRSTEPTAVEVLPTPEHRQEETSVQYQGEVPLALHVEKSLLAGQNVPVIENVEHDDAHLVPVLPEGQHEVKDLSEHGGEGTSASLNGDNAEEVELYSEDKSVRDLDEVHLVGVNRYYPGLRSKLSYFAPLATLVDHYNVLVDTISVVTEVQPVLQAAPGKKDFILTLQLTDQSMAGTTLYAQILRPFKAALPLVEEGDAILLRNFRVKSFNHSIMLASVDTSAWAVFTTLEDKVLVDGPPVEYGSEEQACATDLRQWYQEAGMAMVADNQLQASIDRESREGTPASSTALSDSGSIDSALRDVRGESSLSSRGLRRGKKPHRRITIHELRDGRRYTEVGSPSGKESIHELRDGTVYANL
ncbi:hypothetical protein ETB97_004050 [Aspergillus alliaceus]|uniref:Telomeric single stranded DNA binding POT1/Cdc13 domain-containing protein n=1 Tax=Petromyces alliaceus TaxID=209559 RepID=A0A8H6AGT6_PETAA|nr:hypothetical protein ETB97_004050 [Aspergillus burnettii]